MGLRHNASFTDGEHFSSLLIFHVSASDLPDAVFGLKITVIFMKFCIYLIIC